MKNFIIILLLAFFSCNTAKKTYKLENTEPIVDYNQPYENPASVKRCY